VAKASSQPRAIVIGDFDRDGKPDLAVVNQGSNTLSILLGDGSGRFSDPRSLLTPGSPSALVGADFNQDGKLDLMVVSQGSNSVSVLLGRGDGTFGVTP
jgi:hypothetical protein